MKELYVLGMHIGFPAVDLTPNTNTRTAIDMQFVKTGIRLLVGGILVFHCAAVFVAKTDTDEVGGTQRLLRVREPSFYTTHDSTTISNNGNRRADGKPLKPVDSPTPKVETNFVPSKTKGGEGSDVLVDLKNSRRVTEQQECEDIPIFVVFAIGTSKSMRTNPGNDIDGLRLDAAQSFLDKLNSTRGDKAGVVPWNDDIAFCRRQGRGCTNAYFPIDEGVTGNFDAWDTTMTTSERRDNLRFRIDCVDENDKDFDGFGCTKGYTGNTGGTNTDLALGTAISQLDKAPQDMNAERIIIFLSDGSSKPNPIHPRNNICTLPDGSGSGPACNWYTPYDSQNATNTTTSILSYTNVAKDKGYTIYSVGLGDEPSSVDLGDMATNTGGKFYENEIATNLDIVFDNILVQITIACEGPSSSPSNSPSLGPSLSILPSNSPSLGPSLSVLPSGAPSLSTEPSGGPSSVPSSTPSLSVEPSLGPSLSILPSNSPSLGPSLSVLPSGAPSLSTEPSSGPSSAPSGTPSLSVEPSGSPSSVPSSVPSMSSVPSSVPTVSLSPSGLPSLIPSSSVLPSGTPSISLVPTVSALPSGTPSLSAEPSSGPSSVPSSVPTISPSVVPSLSHKPSSSVNPSMSPTRSVSPSVSPTRSVSPSVSPSDKPSSEPSLSSEPSAIPSNLPSGLPSVSFMPSLSVAPSATPTFSSKPSGIPSSTPTLSILPSASPSLSFNPSSSLSLLPSSSANPTNEHISYPSAYAKPSLSPFTPTSFMPSPVVAPTSIDDRKVVDSSSLTNTIMAGYQGWFGTTCDNGYKRWKHWSGRRIPSADHYEIDMWPDLTEFDSDELCPTKLQYSNGSNAGLFSSFTTKTVERHVKWMYVYGIDGVYVQRFIHEVRHDRYERDQVLDNVRRGSEKYGRVFVNMYDISGAKEEDVYDDLKKDWMHLVDDEKITESDRYLRHNGRPLLAIWGFGFASRVGDPEKVRELIDWFQNNPIERYRVTLKGGLPTYWRTLTRDSKTSSEWAAIYRSFDVIAPWSVGRYGSNNGADRHKRHLLEPDIAECDRLGIEYLPAVFPGYSHSSVYDKPFNEIPRNGGHFFWRQIHNAVEAGSKQVYVSMFDEVDEGTAIFKLAATKDQIPTEGNFITLDADGYDVPNDWYLTLTGHAANLLRSSGVIPRRMPALPGTPPTPPTNPPPTRPPTDPPPTRPPTNPPPTVPPTTRPPTNPPTNPTTDSPTFPPTTTASDSPSESPTNLPTNPPTIPLTTTASVSPSESPTNLPTNSPTSAPTTNTSGSPTNLPTNPPTIPLTTTASDSPTNPPTIPLTTTASVSPSESPTNLPTNPPTSAPTMNTSGSPTNLPTNPPTIPLTTTASVSPSESPTNLPTNPPTHSPTTNPSGIASGSPTNEHSRYPSLSVTPSSSPRPSANPSESVKPSSSPRPSANPSESLLPSSGNLPTANSSSSPS